MSELIRLSDEMTPDLPEEEESLFPVSPEGEGPIPVVLLALDQGKFDAERSLDELAALAEEKGLMLGGALANLIERWARGSVTDYVYLPRAVIPFFRRIIWNAADLSILTGCTTAVIALLCEEL